MAVLWLLLMLAVFYALLIRPQRRQMAAHRELVAAVAEGDEVITTAGIFGTVRRLDEGTCELEVAPGTTIRIARNAIARKVTS
jgi:preprotein translocase subunit YajC